MNAGELRTLTEVAKLLADRDLSALAALRAERQRLAAEAEALRRGAPPPGSDGLDPAARAGAEPRWQRWREQALRRLEAERAALAAKEAAARDAARRSFGRQVALEELARNTGSAKPG